ncbi:MAG: SGNH/GDSL hydrolase family protein [Kofleriaceae bacterium]
MRNQLLAIVFSVATITALTSSAFAAGSESRTLRPSDGTWTTTRVNTAFGDSIAAGYCGIFCRTDSYAVRYGRTVANSLDASVSYRGRAQSGDVMSQIASKIRNNLTDLRAADYITIEGCGNDFLNARKSYRNQSSCTNETVLASALTTCHTNLVSALDTIAANRKAGSKVVVMSLYYPGMNSDKSRICGGDRHFDIFLDYIVEANWNMCNEAWARGFECADGLAAFNAADVDTSLDADSTPDIDQVRINRATDEDNFGAYYDRVIAAKAVLTDANTKRTGTSTVVDYLQSDDVHPTAAGHQRLADEHAAQGL